MEKEIKKEEEGKKGGHKGGRLWLTHRLEGVVKNKAIKPVRKKKKQSFKD